MADEQQKAKARAARFANDAKKPPPPPPKKTFAHPGGRMTTNKEEALREYLARKGDSLNAAQKQALEDLQKKGLAPPTPPKPAEVPPAKPVARRDALETARAAQAEKATV